MKPIILLSFFTLIFLSVGAQDVYIKYDPAYFNKLEYRFIENNSDISYSSYRFNKNANEKIFFETGLENNIVKQSLPGNLINVLDVTFDQNDVAAINKGDKKVYLVKQVNSGYIILPVGNAEYMYYADNLLAYEGTDYALQADFNTALPENLAIETSRSAVFYGGSEPVFNSTAYIFHRSPLDHTCKLSSVLTILPQIGLLKEQVGDSSKFQLYAVDGMNVENFLQGGSAVYTQPSNTINRLPIATTESVITREIPDTYSTTTSQSDQSSYQNSPTITNPCAGKEFYEGQYLVQPGDNLYTISRMYKLTLAQLRSWNDLQENDILYPCSVLNLTNPNPPEDKTTVMESKSVPLPSTYSTTTKSPSASSPCSNMARDGEHIVQYGESLSSIGRQHGISVSALRKWNDFQLKNDAIFPCQRLLVVNPNAESSLASKGIKEKTAFVTSVKSTEVRHPEASKYTNRAPAKIRLAARYSSKDLTPKSISTKGTSVFVKNGIDLHVVKKGETVNSLASEFSLTETRFKSLNKIGKGESLRVGQVVHTKDCSCNTTASIPVKTAQTNLTRTTPKTYSYITAKPDDGSLTSKSVDRKYTTKYHVVQENESLESISDKYNIPVERLRKINNLDKNEIILPNQLLVLDL